MIKELTMYTIICDNCGNDVCEGEEFSGWGCTSYVEEIAYDADWKATDDGKHYCDSCYTYDDNDNLVISDPTKQPQG